MADRFQQMCFWENVYCPSCGVLRETIYLPELLAGIKEYICQRRRVPCGAKWSMALDNNGKSKFRMLIKLAQRRENLLQELYTINETLAQPTNTPHGGA